MPNIKHSECRNLADFAPAYMWRLVPLSTPAGVDFPRDFNLLTKSSTVPKAEPNSVTEITMHNQKRKLPGVEHRTGAITLTCAETVDNVVKNIVASWQRVLQDPETGASATTQDSVGEFLLIQMDGQERDIYQYHLKEVFLEDFDAGTEFVNGESTVVFEDMQLTLSYSTFDEGPNIMSV